MDLKRKKISEVRVFVGSQDVKFSLSWKAGIQLYGCNYKEGIKVHAGAINIFNINASHRPHKSILSKSYFQIRDVYLIYINVRIG